MAAVAVVIRCLGAARAGELVGVRHDTVHKYANPNCPHEPPLRFCLIWDRECWMRHGLAPFRELFEANAGEGGDMRVARDLRLLADQLDGGN